MLRSGVRTGETMQETTSLKRNKTLRSQLGTARKLKRSSSHSASLAQIMTHAPQAAME
jgi:hypothetical protein